MVNQRMERNPDEESTRNETGKTTHMSDGLSFPLNSATLSIENTSAPPERGLSLAEDTVELDDKSFNDDKSSTKEMRESRPRSTSSSTIATESNPPASRHTSAQQERAHTPVERTLSRFSRFISRESRRGPRHDPALEGLDIEKQESLNQNPNQPPVGEKSSDPDVVEWDGPDDPENPQNWPRFKKWYVTIVLGCMTFCITFASSVFSTATVQTAKHFNVSNEVMILGTSLFVLGFAVGPPIWGPLSEIYGRKYPLFIGFFIFAIFQIPVAVAQNLQTIMLCRFFGGVFGSAPLGIVSGKLADFWDSVDRGVAVTIFAGAVFLGPVFGPIIGGFVVDSHLGWRWTEYLTAIMAFFFGTIGFILVPETFGPVILSRRAKKIRFETKNWAVRAKIDEQQIDLRSIARKYLIRPFAMLAFEPILDFVTLYIALIYGIMYLFFEAYPIAFQEQRGWNSGIGALPFLSIIIGVILGSATIVYTTKTRFARKLAKHGRVVPEERLIPMIIGGALFPIGMFWFAWTSSRNITWVPQVLAGIPIGAGVMMIFIQGLNYIVDVYLMYANSAVAANTFLRSLFGASFPLFATAMYHTLGVNWATTLLGFLTAALFPVPILFFFYGKKIRSMSKYSPTK